MMQAADQTPRGQLRHDVAQAVVGVAWRRRIVECQQDAGEDLGQESKQSPTARHLKPSSRLRNILVEKMLDRGLHAGSVFEPIEHASQHSLSSLNLRPDEQLAVVHASHITIQRTWGRSAEDFAVDVKNHSMSGEWVVILMHV